MSYRRRDDVERKTISAHVDKRLVDYLEDQRLSKSEWVEKGLRMVLENTMSDKELAIKLKMEADREREALERSQRRIEEIDKKAVATLGTTLDEFFEKHEPKSKRDEWLEQFTEGWLDSYVTNRKGTIPPAEYLATEIYDVVLAREFGLTGKPAIDFIQSAIDRYGEDVNVTSNAPKLLTLY